MMPLPTCMRSVLASTYGMNTSFDDRWEYSVRKWCSVTHEYLKPALSAATLQLDLVLETLLLDRPLVVDVVVGLVRRVQRVEDPKLHEGTPSPASGAKTITRSSSGRRPSWPGASP